MNVFFTCKNTLVIILQFYRLFVVQVERKKEAAKSAPPKPNISSNLALAIERAAFLGPSSGAGSTQLKQKDHLKRFKEGAGGGVRTSSAQKLQQDSPSCSKQSGGKKSDRADISPKNRFKGRRKSLSTGNLVNCAEEEREESLDCAKNLDDMPLSISSTVSDRDSQDLSIDMVDSNISVRFENERRPQKLRFVRLICIFSLTLML